MNKTIKEIKMNKTSVLLLLILTLILTACSNAPTKAGPAGAGNATSGVAAGELSAPIQVALGTIKLDGTENAVTADQAKELLPLWETLQDLEGSDTAATEEKDALISQIQETMTADQTQAIAALGLSRQDMFSVMQSQVQTVEGRQNTGSSQSGSTSTNRGGFGQGGGFGGPPPDGGFGGGNPNFQGQRSQSGTSTTGRTSSQPAAVDLNRIPTPLIQAVIEYLKTKAGA
jgi:hypothetical protein